MSSQVIPGRQMACRGRFEFIVSRRTSPLILRYEFVAPSCRHSACLPSTRKSGSRYFSQISGGSTTCESLSNTARRFVRVVVMVRLLPARYGSIGRECRLHLLLGRPPIRPLDLGDAVANDL